MPDHRRRHRRKCLRRHFDRARNKKFNCFRHDLFSLSTFRLVSTLFPPGRRNLGQARENSSGRGELLLVR
jgi:hypothetical protein